MKPLKSEIEDRAAATTQLRGQKHGMYLLHGTNLYCNQYTASIRNTVYVYDYSSLQLHEQSILS